MPCFTPERKHSERSLGWPPGTQAWPSCCKACTSVPDHFGPQLAHAVSAAAQSLRGHRLSGESQGLVWGLCVALGCVTSMGWGRGVDEAGRADRQGYPWAAWGVDEGG